jgi:putative addiction module component (TIGR02574 family)
MTISTSSVLDLSLSEKLQLVEDLWDDIASNPEAVPIYDWQKEELERRRKNLASHPDSALSWEEIRQRIQSRYGR